MSIQGTPFFMPVEILSGKYLLDTYYYDPSKPEEQAWWEEDEDEEQTSEEDEDEEQTSEPKEEDKLNTLADQLHASTRGPDYVENLKHFKPFHEAIPVPPNPCWDMVPQAQASVNHNYQHDLESIWWILLWIILCRIKPHTTSKKTSQKVLQYFDHDIRNFRRRRELFTTSLTEVRPFFPKHIFKRFWDPLEKLRKSMHKAYVGRAVFGHLEISESYSDIQAQFAKALRAILAKGGSWNNMELLKKSPSKGSGKGPSHHTHASMPSATSLGKRDYDAYVPNPEEEDDDDDEEDRPIKPKKPKLTAPK